MSTLKDELELIQQARDDIQTALITKGQSVGKNIRDYAQAISDINVGSGDVKLFDTIEHMQQDPNANEGDLAIIYRTEYNGVEESSIFSSCKFPNTVNVNTEVTNTIRGNFSSTTNILCDGSYIITPTEFRLNMYENSRNIDITYISNDGITYTRTDGGTELQEFATTIRWVGYDKIFNDAISYFIKILGNYFGGLFEYTINGNTASYTVADNQLSAINDYVYDKIYMGQNGVATGTLQETNITNVDKLRKSVTIWNTLNNITVNITDLSNAFVSYEIEALPSMDTHLVSSMYAMCSNCRNLAYVPMLDTSNVVTMESMFSSCVSLTSIPLFNTYNVENMALMFNGDLALTELPLLNTHKVKSMYGMLWGCKSLTTIPLLDTSSAENLANMFYVCENLTSIPSLDTTKSKYMTEMFGLCSRLSTVPILNTSKVVEFHYAFLGCSSLSNQSLNNIMQMCINAVSYTGTKTLAYLGITDYQATICQGLSNYQSFINAGWTTGY